MATITFTVTSPCPACDEPLSLVDVPTDRSFVLGSVEFIVRRWRKDLQCLGCNTRPDEERDEAIWNDGARHGWDDAARHFEGEKDR